MLTKIKLTSFFILFSFCLYSNQIIVPFDNPDPGPPNACMDSWTESGIPQQMVPTMGGSCSFDYAVGHVWLFPSQLKLDVSSVSNINFITVTVTDFCGPGCTSATYFANGNNVGMTANTTVGPTETMTFTNSNNDPIDEIFLQSFEGRIEEVLIDFDPIINNCPPNLDVDFIPIDDGVYQSGLTINSAGLVPAGADVTFASSEIMLNDGFEVQNNATFAIVIDPCI